MGFERLFADSIFGVIGAQKGARRNGVDYAAPLGGRPRLRLTAAFSFLD